MVVFFTASFSFRSPDEPMVWGKLGARHTAPILQEQQPIFLEPNHYTSQADLHRLSRYYLQTNVQPVAFATGPDRGDLHVGPAALRLGGQNRPSLLPKTVVSYHGRGLVCASIDEQPRISTYYGPSNCS